MDPLSSDEELCPLLEPVRVTENHFGQGGATARVMDDVLSEYRIESTVAQLIKNDYVHKDVSPYLHNPLDVTIAFSKVNMTEFSRTFPVLDVGFEHGARTFSLSPDHTSHRALK